MKDLIKRARKFSEKIGIRLQFTLSFLFFIALFMITLVIISNYQEKRITRMFSETQSEKIETFDKIIDLASNHLQILIYSEYSQWDEMVKFVYKFDKEFARVNLDWLIYDYDFNSIWVVDTLYQIKYLATDSLLIQFPLESDIFNVLRDNQRELKFYKNINNQIVEFFCTSIHESSDEYAMGKVYGYIIAARIIENHFIEELEKIFNSSITLDTNKTTESLTEGQSAIIQFSKSLNDINNRAVAYYNIKLESDLIIEAIASSRSLLLIYAHISLLILVIFVFLYIRLVSNPLKRITDSLDKQTSEPLDKLLSQKDEYGEIAKLINSFFRQKKQLEHQISQRVKAESNLQRLNKMLKERVSLRTAELKALIDQAPIAIGIFDENGSLIESNQVYKNLFNDLGHEYNSLRELNSQIFNNQREYSKKIEEIMERGGEFYTLPVNIGNSNNDELKNSYQWLIFRFFSIRPENSEEFRIVNIVEDVSENKKMEEAEKKLTANERISLAIYNAQEEERKRVSRELHDSIGQKLSTVQMKLELFNKEREDSNVQINDIKQTIFSTGKELRTIIRDLHPQDIDDYGLVKSLDLLCSQISNMTNIKIYFNAYDYPANVDKNTELNIYRIVQEALNNVSKHSRATEASVQIYHRDKMLMINIEDNGIGIGLDIDKDLPELKSSYGLLNMKRRTETLKGNLYIDSSQSLGTEIHIKIPWGKNG